MPQYLYRLSLTRPALLTEGPIAAEQATLGRHLAYLEDLKARGSLILAGRTLTTGPETFGIAIFEAGDETAARRVMNADPAVAEGLMTAELFPYRVAVARDGWGSST
jgi:uncharacterized protein YciI